MDCFVASLLAMTMWLDDVQNKKARANGAGLSHV